MAVSQNERPDAARSRFCIAVCLAVAAGIALRFAWPLDIEYKGDEQWTFEQAHRLLAGGPWRWIGMPTSFGPPNPGLSLWLFAGMAWLFGADTAPALARVVQSLNATGLCALLLFAWRAVPKPQRELWLWGCALWAVNPLAIVYERKIWPPSVLPAFTVALIVAWWYRRRLPAAVVWGLIGALMAQIHIGAGFFALMVALWTALSKDRTANWWGWLIGSAVGALPSLPWFSLLITQSQRSGMELRLPLLHFFVRAFTQPFGLGIDFLLTSEETARFLAGPTIGGVPTYLMAAAHLAALALCATVFALAVRRMWQLGPHAPRSIFLGYSPATVFASAAIWGYGGCLTLMSMIGLISARNHMIVIAPLLGLWLSALVLEWAAPWNRRIGHVLLVCLCVVQGTIALGILSFVHDVQVMKGEYGPTWRSQQSPP